MKTKGIYFLYRLLQAAALPALLLYFFLRGLRNRGYWKSLRERLGFLPRSFRQTGPGAIWLHAVSVGEILACVEFLRRLHAAFPHSRLFVSVSTLAGYATAREKLQGLADGVFFAPADYVFAVRRVLRVLRPSVVVVAETEIWPNLFREVKRTGAGLLVANGRISDRAFPRYLPYRWFFRHVLPSADAILAQTPAMAERFAALGAPQERVQATGNLKYDFEPREAPAGSPVVALVKRTGPANVCIAASTMPPAETGDVDEDDAVITAFEKLGARHPGLLLILAPRKPERFDVVARKLEASGVRFLRRTQLAGQTEALPFVLLLDTIGELSGLFGLADVVFMGGTLALRGGHNILEPALFGKPVIVGPHMENFQAIADEFRACGAVIPIAGAAELAHAVERCLDHPAEAQQTGARALACASANRGATARTVEEVRALHARQVPCYRLAQPWRLVRWPLAKLWGWGARRNPAPGRLNAPVVSIGNLTMGGTGKTPCVLRVAELLAARGCRPGILTRGYGRSSPEKLLVLPPGANVRPDRTGDEPQIFLRSGLAPVGIGGDRYQTGLLLLRDFPVDTILLDDGFQHRKLARDVDIVLIDALNPFGGGELFPLGRLREPVSGLARADLVVIARSEYSDLGPAVESTVRRWNRKAPIYRAFIEPVAWVENRTGRHFPIAAPPFDSAAAFCGLGNPTSFRRTLEALGVPPVDWVEFEDHHRYRPYEIQRVARQARATGAAALLTTEKDLINLCDRCDDLVAPLPLYWLHIGLRIEREDEFIRELETRLACART